MTAPTIATDRGPRGAAAFRAGVCRAAAGPVAALTYAVGTIGSPNRPAMLAVLAGLGLILAVLWLAAEPILAARHRALIQDLAIVVVVVGLAGLLLLDGGVASPLGALVVYSLLFFGATVPSRLFVTVAALGGAAYALVALFGEPAPQGYAATMMIGAVGIGYLCRRYAGALAALRHRLTELSTVDPLTGCLNRRGFDDRLVQEMAQANRTGDSVTLVLVDLDRFKDVNDSYGHAAGDDLLKWTGTTLTDTVRAHDSVGRIGGDEFAVILVNTAAEAASTAVDRLRASVGEMSAASYGFAVYPDDGNTAVELHQCADERLYEDKARQGQQPPALTRETLAAVRTEDESEGHRSKHSRKVDRLRHTVMDLGLLCTFCHLTGLLYVLVLAPDRPHRFAIAAVLAVGAGCGVIEVLCADRIARTRWAGVILTGLAIPEFAAAAVAVVLDGGVLSPMSFGLVAPLPMVAYSSPPRRAAPIVVGVLAAYTAIGVILGGVSAWYIALYIGGSLALVFACGQLGREAARQRKRLHGLSRADAMTGCLNRRGFEERFAAELAHADRSERGLALLLLDLDGFKRVNDTLGHAGGDELLVWVADALGEAAHPHDVIGRLGGDEFAVLLTAQLPEPENDVAERLRAVLSERISASIGLAHLGVDGDDLETLYALADSRLYHEKHRIPRTAPPAPGPDVTSDPVRP